MGCGAWVAGFLILALAFMIIAYNINKAPGSGITPSTVARKALPAGSVNETDYYADNLDWISNRTAMLAGLKHFYQRTGVQPFIYITDTVNGSHSPSTDELDVFANGLYDQLFTDEAHILLVFFEYGDGYMDRYVCGTQAKTVIDTEAADILLDFIDRNYYDKNLTDEQFFSNSFSDAADRIMMVTRSPWIPVFLVFGFIALAAIMFIWWRNAKAQKNLEAKRAEEILNAPLQKFGETEVDRLAKKYEDDKTKPAGPEGDTVAGLEATVTPIQDEPKEAAPEEPETPGQDVPKDPGPDIPM